MNNEAPLEAVYERVNPDAELPDDLRLTVAQWATLFSCDGNRCLIEIALDLRSTPDRILESLHHLASLGLVRERQLHLAEYSRVASVAAAAASAESPLSLKELARRHDALAEARRTFLSKTSEKSSTPPPHIPFQPLARREVPSPQPPDFTTKNPMHKTLNLGGLIRFIASRDKDSSSGQLAVYRIFMGVNTALLREAGIHSLRFDDTVHVSNPTLISAISKSVQKNLGIPIPEHLFSETDAPPSAHPGTAPA